MSGINTNIMSLVAQRSLGQNNLMLEQSLQRLSTGYKINRAADGPADLIASERLRSEQAGINAAIANAERADQVINIAEGGLIEINSLLIELQSLVGQSANASGLGPEEVAGNQAQIDSILHAIDRITQSTTFEGVQLLNGTFEFMINSQHANVSDLSINAAKLEAGDTRQVSVAVTAPAQHGGLFLYADGSTELDLADMNSTFVLEVSGARGSREFAFASGTELASIAADINQFASVLGVSATADGTGLLIKSTGYGSDQFVSVDVVNDGGQVGSVFLLDAADENLVDMTSGIAFSAVREPIRDEGQDVRAIINGVLATSEGTTVRTKSDFLDVEIELSTAGATSLSEFTAFEITGGGALFNIGPSVNIANQVSIGINNVAARFLGRTVEGSTIYHLDDLASGKGLNMETGLPEFAQEVVDAAITEMSALRARLGVFQKNTIGSTIRSLGVALENTIAAESAIRDTDFAQETAELARAQILVSASTKVLAIANSQPQQVLALLG